MLFAFIVWLVSTIGAIKGFFGFLAVACVVVVVVWGFSELLDYESGGRIVFNKPKQWLVGLALCFGFIGTLLPTERTAWFMVGGYAVQQATESELADGIYKLALKKINEELKPTQAK